MNQFIQDAIKGGWKAIVTDERALLCPKAWQAVGKTRGWNDNFEEPVYEGMQRIYANRSPQEKMHTFLDHLIDGLSIEEALDKIK